MEVPVDRRELGAAVVALLGIVAITVAPSCAAVSGLDAYDLVDCPTPAACPALADAGPGNAEAGGPKTDAGGRDAGPPGPSRPCDPSKPFGPLARLDSLTGQGREGGVRFLPDELTVVFSAYRNGSSGHDLYLATRPDLGSPFGTASRLPISTGGEDLDPMLTPSGQTLFFGSSGVLWTASRRSDGSFENVRRLSGPGTDRQEAPFWLEATNQLYYASQSARGVLEIHRATIDASKLVPLGPEPRLVSNDSSSTCPVLSADGLTLYFSTGRTSGQGADIWRSTRSKVTDDFGAPAAVSELNTQRHEYANWLSVDGCRLYLTSDRDGTFHAYVAARGK